MPWMLCFQVHFNLCLMLFWWNIPLEKCEWEAGEEMTYIELGSARSKATQKSRNPHLNLRFNPYFNGSQWTLQLTTWFEIQFGSIERLQIGNLNEFLQHKNTVTTRLFHSPCCYFRLSTSLASLAALGRPGQFGRKQDPPPRLPAVGLILVCGWPGWKQTRPPDCCECLLSQL